MINKVTLIGNLGKDPEVRKLESGASVAKFSVATNENYRDKNGEWQTITEWHNVVAWRGLADRAERNLKKGGMVYVEGKLSTRKWQDQNGNDRYSTDVVALQLRSLDRKPASDVTAVSENFPSNKDEYPKVEASSNNMKIEEDDLPF